jgi:hypothetical protein
MILPNQAPPVQREGSIEKRDRSKAVEPQAKCKCRHNGGGNYTCWCLIGTEYVNTGKQCDPVTGEPCKKL